MDNIERQLLLVLNGVEHTVSPTTNSDTVVTDSGEKLSDILDKYIPIELTQDAYSELVRSGNIDPSKFYIVYDDSSQAFISDLVISRNSTFSSKKILELLASNSGFDGLLGPLTCYFALDPDKWVSVGDNAKAYTILQSNITSSSLISVSVSNRLSNEDYQNQMNIVRAAMISRIKQDDGSITLYSYGVTPTTVISLDVTIFN